MLTQTLDRLLDGFPARPARIPSVLTLTLVATLACSPAGENASAATEREPHEETGRVEATVATAERHVDDAILHFEVKARLLDELGWSAIGIDVDSVNGRVLLTGEVPERSDRELAEEIVRSVDGVEDVESRLVLEETRSEDSTRSTAAEQIAEVELEVRDALLEARLKARLLEEIGRHALDLEVEAADGVVTLRGHLASEVHEQLALETTSRTKGVVKVVNLIET